MSSFLKERVISQPEKKIELQDKKDLLSRIAICLVEPIKGGNVGSVARAMKNSGLSRLILVNPPELDTPECRMMGMDALDLVINAEVHTDLKEAIAPFDICVSTTRRLSKNRRPDFSPRSFAAHVLPLLGDSQAVILFGREDKGLSTKEIDLAPLILTIPSDEAYESLNISQAVMVIAHELFVAAVEPPDYTGRQPAASEQIERFFGQARPLLLECGFLLAENPDWILRAFRKMVHKARLDHREIKILRGVCSNMEWYLSHVAKVGERDGEGYMDRSGGPADNK